MFPNSFPSQLSLLDSLSSHEEQREPTNRPDAASRVAQWTPGTSKRELRGRLERTLAEHRSAPRLGAIVLTRNRSTFLSMKERQPGLYDLRIHRCFVAAPDPVLAEIGHYLFARLRKTRARALTVLRTYFAENAHIEPPTPQRVEPVGRIYDLSTILYRLSDRYFDGQLKDLTITWGKPPRRSCRSQRSIQLGSYQEHDRIIRIHQVLDQATVPVYVLESVVYHEMLHAVVPSERRGSRRVVHSREFLRREQLYEHIEQAEDWIESGLFPLLKAWGTRISVDVISKGR